MKDIIVVGNGPAVYMAAVYTRTANFSTLVVEDRTPEYLSFTGCDKVAGVLNIETPKSLINVMQQQVSKFGVESVCANVLKLVFKERHAVLETSKGTFEGRSVILDDSIVFERLFGKCADKGSLEKQGVFPCGTITEPYKEAVILIASGCRAAFYAKEFLGR